MEDLFLDSTNPPASSTASAHQPLAARLRPRDLNEYVGQEHILGPNKPLRRMIETDWMTSLVLFGPPGVGKTSLAELIAIKTQSRFVRCHGVEAKVSDLRNALRDAKLNFQRTGVRTLLFIDEIHRLNKLQQDELLADVEAGHVRLIGATTHNLTFYLNAPLVSRSQIFELKPLSEEVLSTLIDRALTDAERGFGALNIKLEPQARAHLIASSDGDARRCLNGLELAVLSTHPNADGIIPISKEIIAESIQKKGLLYDHDGDEHYNTISAFIKSVRGSDPDAAIYWLAKMIESGEDPRFIARRLVLLAAEDIGLADPRGLMVAVAAHQAVEFIGMPEGRIPLADATIYLATAPKSNRAYLAGEAALEAVRSNTVVAVPTHLRNKMVRSTGAPKKEKYQYSHDFEGGISSQSYGIEPGRFYTPGEAGYEKLIEERLTHWKQLRANSKKPPTE